MGYWKSRLVFEAFQCRAKPRLFPILKLPCRKSWFFSQVRVGLNYLPFYSLLCFLVLFLLSFPYLHNNKKCLKNQQKNKKFSLWWSFGTRKFGEKLNVESFSCEISYFVSCYYDKIILHTKENCYERYCLLWFKSFARGC